MKEYLKLLVGRESKVVLGKGYSNLWLLTIVLIATFVSISFSNGSMIYLNEKMNDPFTNWVNIANEFGDDNFVEFKQRLDEVETQERYLFEDVQSDYYFAFTFIGENNKSYYLRCRFFERINGNLFNKILEKENVVNNCVIPREQLQNNTLGLVVTESTLLKLGYSLDSIPAYINLLTFAENGEAYDLEIIDRNKTNTPIPLLAVVKRLPMNMDVIGANFFYIQTEAVDKPLNIDKEQYHRDLRYFVAEQSVAVFESKVKSLIPDSLQRSFEFYDDPRPETITWKPGKSFRLYVGNLSTSLQAYLDINNRILSTFSDEEVVRIYDYVTSDYDMGVQTTYLSVQFSRLDSIRSFERLAKEEYNVQIEMSQVNAKENFNAVSIMASILSTAMIIFSIVCIIMFIVNMLQSYFQKVKRNMGTFKAFGISTQELIGVYILILFTIIMTAIVLALFLVWAVEIILPLFGILKDGEFSYLALWNAKTICSVLVVIASTIITVYVVMKKLLGKTPGDLIYDRD